MGWTNYHSHSHYSDGKESIRDFILAALDQHLEVFGISDHAPVPFESTWSMKEEKLSEYTSEIKALKEEFKGKMEIVGGLEVDYFPDSPFSKKDFIDSLELDFIIGAVHFADPFPDGKPYNIDGEETVYQKGIDEIYDGNPQKLVERYYDIFEEMIEALRPDIVAHFDKIKLFNTGNKYFSEKESWYKDRVIRILDLLAKHNIVMEINTRGFYSKNVRKFYPASWIVCEAHHRGIPVMINSDCHHSTELTKSFKLAAEILLDAGYKELTILKNGSWQQRKFGRAGLV